MTQDPLETVGGLAPATEVVWQEADQFLQGMEKHSCLVHQRLWASVLPFGSLLDSLEWHPLVGNVRHGCDYLLTVGQQSSELCLAEYLVLIGFCSDPVAAG